MYIYTYMIKKFRHKIIKEIIQNQDITSQDMLLNILIEKGFELTQATLSRDIKELKIIKVPNSNGVYNYRHSESIPTLQQEDISLVNTFKFVNIDFSGQLAVVKTRPGYAMAIAGEIDKRATQCILGTVAGDDTILLIPREGKTRDEIIESLSQFMP